MAVKYKITNPYESVSHLLGADENHYKTNLHTHSTYSDANFTMVEMIESFYEYDFDILAFAEHGVHGKEWDKEPTLVNLYKFQKLWHGERKHLNTEQYKAILDGTYKTKEGRRTKKRGLLSVTDAIEANMLTLVKNHVNGYFTDDSLEGIYGKENNFEAPIKRIEETGGLSHINHPTDWLQAVKYPDCATKKENVDFFADILRRYKSCLGIEVLNMYDKPNFCDRILWDSLLKTLIPEGERSVWGFGNSDAHRVHEADTAFMDFILPKASRENVRTAMEKGTFFPVARYAKYELGEDFVGEGAYPSVTEITVDEDAQTITITGESCNAIEWVADGKVIFSTTVEADGKITSTIDLLSFAEDISCYVRAQLKGKGGICMTQPFTLDDGDIRRFAKPIPEKKKLSKKEQTKENFLNTRLGVVVYRMILGK